MLSKWFIIVKNGKYTFPEILIVLMSKKDENWLLHDQNERIKTRKDKVFFEKMS